MSPDGALTVLVADDDDSVRRLVGLALELDGFTVVTAADGPGALDAVRRSRPAVAILDDVLPGMSGRELCRRIRAEFGPEMFVVMVTGQTDLAHQLEAIESGVDEFVARPVRVADLVERVKGYLKAETGDRQLLGAPRLYDILRQRLASAEAVAAVVIEVHGLNAFSRRYSFRRAEHVLRFVGDLLVEVAAGHPRTQAARLSVESFGIVTGADSVEAVTADLDRRFSDGLARFYDPEDARRGSIDVTDRTGHVRRYRLVRLAVGVAESRPARPRHHLEVLERASEMARHARAHGPVSVDRRLT